MSSKFPIKMALYLSIICGILILIFYGWKAAVAAIAAIFAFQKPIEKVKEKVDEKIKGIDSSPDPHAGHSNNIADQLRKRRSRKDR